MSRKEEPQHEDLAQKILITAVNIMVGAIAALSKANSVSSGLAALTVSIFLGGLATLGVSFILLSISRVTTKKGFWFWREITVEAKVTFPLCIMGLGMTSTALIGIELVPRWIPS